MSSNNYEDFYENMQLIGNGTFSSVYKSKVKDKEEYVAIKLADKEKIKLGLRNEYNKQNIEYEYYRTVNYYNEVKYLEICGKNNENSVKYIQHFETENEFIIVMELCDMNLVDFIKFKKDFTISDINDFLCQINNTFKIMKEKNIAHRDLKLQNILVNYKNKEKTEYIYKITDYGISKELLSLSKRFTSKVGTVNFMAPEVLNGEKYDIECDLWSLGVIIYILYFKNYPYPAMNEMALIKQINSLGQKTFKTSENKDFDNLIKGLLTSNPKERLTWAQYFNHPFFGNKPFKEPKLEIKNEINILLKVREIDIKKGNKIYFLESDLMRNNLEPKHTNIDNLNDTNTELYINGQKTKFTKFIPSSYPANEYKIKIVFKNRMNDCSYMFRGCPNIIKLDLSSFDTSNVVDMKHMFSICCLLKEINLSNLKTEQVTDMSYMFNKCLSLEKLELPPSFITKKVNNMEFMFHMCTKLKKIDFPKSFITNNVTNMSVMFGKCHSLESLDLRNFVTENVNNMKYMFDQCINLEKILIDPNKFKTNKVTNMGHMFNECQNLETIDLSQFNIGNVRYLTSTFNGCEKLNNNYDLSRFHIQENVNMPYIFNNENLNVSSSTNGTYADTPRISRH